MIWLTWRQCRTQFLAVYGLVAAACVWLAITGPALARLARRNDNVYDLLTANDRLLFNGGIAALAVAPAVIGIFWGAPLVARELETGTHRLAWNQSVTRGHWLAAKLAFSVLAAAVAVGSAMMLPWFEPEITPLVERPFPVRVGLDAAAPERHVRAIVEAQMMAMASHSAWTGVTPRAIHATGGASANAEILRVMADVFDAAVYHFDSIDSAALGAALRAWQAEAGLKWREVVSEFEKPLSKVITPIESNVRIYQTLKSRYEVLEAGALRQ